MHSLGEACGSARPQWVKATCSAVSVTALLIGFAAKTASADPHPAVEGTTSIVPALALGMTHARVVAAAATAPERAIPLEFKPFEDLVVRVKDVVNNGVELNYRPGRNGMHLRLGPQNAGGALYLSYRY